MVFYTGIWVLSVHAAVLIFGLTALFSKIIILSAIEITLLRSLVAFIAIALYIKYLKESLLLKFRKDYFVVIILGVLLGGHWVTYFHAMQVSSIAVGMVALYTYPVMTVFLEPLFNKESIKGQDVISAFIVLFGIYLIVPEFSFDHEVTQGVVWGVISAFLFAMRNLIHGHYFSGYKARHALFYQTLVVFIMLLPFVGQTIPQVTQMQWLQLILLGLFFTAIPHTLFAHSLLHLKAKTVSLISCMQVAYGALFAALFLAEVVDLRTLMGGALVISAAVFETVAHRKKIKT